jgi:3-hydroxybutyryl-CoA dehydrogenase
MVGFRRVGVIGAGAMGTGIAQMAAEAGASVLLVDARDGAAADAIRRLCELWDGLAAKGRRKPEDVAGFKARVTAAGGLAGLSACDLAVEAIIEDLAAKQALFRELEGIVAADAVLATNTSSLSVTAIAAVCRHPERVAGWHFFNPVALMRVVEVIGAARTALPVLDRLAAFTQSFGHRAVRCLDSPGFIVNHVGRGFGTEALQIVAGEGAAGFADVDRALRDQAGFRLGPFELWDLTGLDVSQPVMEQIFRSFSMEPRFRPSWLLKQRLDAGLLGRKTGEGFYRYPGGRKVEPAEERPAPALPLPVFIASMPDDTRMALAGIIRAAGWPLAAGEGEGILTLAAPVGHDATGEAMLLGLDPRNLVAVDTVFGLSGRRVIMTPPGGLPEMRAAAAALLSADGTAVTAIRDSAGFIAQRVVATIVNIASDMAQQGIASPADIDDAVRLGLGYPAGPLTLGDQVGSRRIVAVLDAIHARSGDPRYRTSPWLRRRAELGLSLLDAG